MPRLLGLGLFGLSLCRPLAADEAIGSDIDVHGRKARVAFVDSSAGHPPTERRAGPGAHGGALRDAGCAADWAALGPFGGDVQDVAVSPLDSNVVLAGIAPSGSSGGTLYRSTNGGDTWTEVATLAGKSVYDIEFTGAGIVYLGTIDSVWRSDDGGASFTPRNLTIGANDQVFEVTIDPGDESVVWAGIADALGNQAINLMRSPDGGATWFNRTPPLAAPQSCRGIAIHPTNSQKIYAAFGGSFGGGQVWVSSNGGAGWQDRSAGLPGNPLNDIAHDGSRVLVTGGQLFGSQFVGLYSSVDQGMNWAPLHDASWPSLVAQDIEIDPDDAQNLWLATTSGVYSSTDGGAGWSFGIGGTGALSCNEVARDPGAAGKLFVGASSVAVFRSQDGGASFLPASEGIGQLNVFSAAVNPNNPSELAIAFQGLNDGGVYTSLDGGLLWSLAGGLPGTRYTTARFAPNGTLYAVSDGPTTIGPEALYRRGAGGTWTNIGPDQGPVFETRLAPVAFSDGDPDLIVAGGADFGAAGFEPTVWVTSDGGAEWDKTYEGPDQNENVQDVEILRDGSDLRMVASFTDFGAQPQTGGALRSTDGGMSWAPASDGLASTAQGYALSQDASDPNTLYFADGRNGGGVYVSHDAGQSWSAAGATGAFRGIECDPVDPGILYVMQLTAPKVRISCDAGATLAPYDTGLVSAGASRGTFLAPTDVSSLLFFATGTGLYVTAGCGVGCALPGCEIGDLNGDCAVDIFDLAVQLSNFGATQGATAEQGDTDGDGDIDIVDLAQLLSAFGSVCS